jgi:hypothetical protein
VRRNIAAAVAVLAVVLAGPASAQAAVRVPPRAERNYRAAERDVSARLSKVPLPAGATPTAQDPASSTGALRGAAFVTLSLALVDTHEFWRVPGEQPGTALAWFQSHLPAGAGVYGTGTSSGPGYTQSDLGLGYRAVPDRLPIRELSISLTTASGGGTAIRIDADDVYWIPRPKWERIPARVRTIDVTVQRTDPTSASSMKITAPAKIAKVVSLVNAQPQTQPYVLECPVFVGPDVTVKFYGASRSVPVAIVVANGSSCGGALVTLRGRPAPDLSSGPTLADDFGRLLGFKG